MIRLVLAATLVTTLNAFNETQFRNLLINHYNFLRSLHNAPPLKVDPSLDRSAVLWARHLSTFANDKCGENIYFTWSTSPVTEEFVAKQAAKAFYEEIKFYDYARPGLVIRAAHFTNLVWKAVDSMGIGIFINEFRNRHGACNVQGTPNRPAKGYMVVIHQSPPSNIMTAQEFSSNVVPPTRMFQFS